MGLSIQWLQTMSSIDPSNVVYRIDRGSQGRHFQSSQFYARTPVSFRKAMRCAALRQFFRLYDGQRESSLLTETGEVC